MTEGNKPRKPRWQTRWGHPGLTYDYGQDVGSLHILDHLLYRATRDLAQFQNAGVRITQLTCTSRYLDGEEEREGLYR